MFEKIRDSEKIIYIGSIAIGAIFYSQLFNFPNKLTLCFIFLICLVQIFANKIVLVGIRETLLLLTLLFYVVISGRMSFSGLSIVFLPILFQLTARYLIYATQDEVGALKRMLMLIGVFVIGYTVHGMLNTKIFFDFHFELVGGRRWPDYWTGNSVPATQHNIYFLPTLAIAFPGMLFIKNHKILYGATLISIIYFIWFSILSRSRTPLIILTIILTSEALVFFVLNFNKIKKKYSIISVAVFLALLGCISLIIWYKRDVFISSSLFTTISRDGGILHNVRFQAQLNVLKQLFVYPFGGYQMDLAGLNYAHNVWLDMANAAGIIPFVLMVAYTLLAAYDLLMFLRNAYIGQELKYVVSGLWFAFMLYYMVEPALEATVQFIVPWTYMNGLIYEYNKKVNSEVAIDEQR